MKIFYSLLVIFFCIFNQKGNAQAVTLTPQGNTSSSFSLATTIDVSQTGTPTVSQLIYNTNASVTGTYANGVGYYFWNGSNWKSLDANIPQSTIIFSETHPNQTLINSGFSMIGTTQISTPALDVWRKISVINAPLSTNSVVASYFGKFYFFGNSNSNRAIYDPETDIWTKMDSLNAPTASNSVIFYKDRVLVLNFGNGVPTISNARIYNPQTNSWEILSSINSPTGQYYTGSSNKQSNYIFNWDGQLAKVLNLLTNTWTTVSTTHAPPNTTNANYIEVENLGTKIFFEFQENGITNRFIYTLSNDQWNSVGNLNAPTDYWGRINGLSNDTTAYFFNYNYSSNITKFKKYSLLQDVWSDALDSLVINSNENSNLNYIGKKGDKLYFSNGQLNIFVFDNILNQWKRVLKHEDDIEGREPEGNNTLNFCNGTIIKFGGFFTSTTYYFHDGYLYNSESETWKYISPVFGRAIPVNGSQSKGISCCNDKYFISYFKSTYLLTNTLVNKSGIMQISGSTNQTTKKLMYLYKKL